jgi:hypothetical protein
MRQFPGVVVLGLGLVHCGADGTTPFDGAAGAASMGAAAATGGFGAGGGVPPTGGFGAAPATGGAPPFGGAPQVGSPNTAPGFMNLAPPMLAPLDPALAAPLNPPAPAGWSWFPIEGTQCRDGTPAGMFVRFTPSDKLFIYFEGGGACSNLGFCNFNPPNVNMVLSGTGETVLGSALGAIAGRQQPGVFEGGIVNGMFDDSNPQNPFAGWNGVYIPYCTGDIHSGTKPNGMVPGLTTPQQFVGRFNTEKFIGHIVPTFAGRVSYVIATGASAGSFGAAMNLSMIQDAFGPVRVEGILDSGLPFSNTYMPPCMQARWRDAWGLNAALPPDCTGCFDADGGNMLQLADYLLAKHPNSRMAIISSMNDEVIRLFFSVGMQNCANYDTADPVAVTLASIDPNVYYPAADYAAGIEELRAYYAPTDRMATYLLGGLNITFHQHVWRARFYQAASGAKTIADFVRDFMAGAVEQIGP